MDKIYWFITGFVAAMAITMIAYGWWKGSKNYEEDEQ